MVHRFGLIFKLEYWIDFRSRPHAIADCFIEGVINEVKYEKEEHKEAGGGILGHPDHYLLSVMVEKVTEIPKPDYQYQKTCQEMFIVTTPVDIGLPIKTLKDNDEPLAGMLISGTVSRPGGFYQSFKNDYVLEKGGSNIIDSKNVSWQLALGALALITVIVSIIIYKKIKK